MILSGNLLSKTRVAPEKTETIAVLSCLLFTIATTEIGVVMQTKPVKPTNTFTAKHCTKCGCLQDLSKFSKNKSGPKGLECRCKKCKGKSGAQWRSVHVEYVKKTKQQYYKTHRKQTDKITNQWAGAHPESGRERMRRWRKANPKKNRLTSQRAQAKKLSTPSGQLNQRVSCLIRKALHKNKQGRRWESLVNFTLDELKARLESKFVGGMSWKNMGSWHIDHIIPQTRFHYEYPEDSEFQACWNLDNFQPLWAFDNLSKNAQTMEEWQNKQKEKNGS